MAIMFILSTITFAVYEKKIIQIKMFGKIIGILFKLIWETVKLL